MRGGREETVEAGGGEKESGRGKKTGRWRRVGGWGGVDGEEGEEWGATPPTDDRLMNLWMKSCRGCPLGCG